MINETKRIKAEWDTSMTRRPFDLLEFYGSDEPVLGEAKIERLKAMHERNEDERIKNLVTRAAYKPTRMYPLGYSARIGNAMRRQLTKSAK